jgi:hypothetical protein
MIAGIERDVVEKLIETLTDVIEELDRLDLLLSAARVSHAIDGLREETKSIIGD